MYSPEYGWYCPNCREWMDRGEQAVVCDTLENCPYHVDWGGSPCGYIVCRECHTPAQERVVR